MSKNHEKAIEMNGFSKDAEATNKAQTTDQEKDAPGGFGIRHLQTLLLFFGLTVAYALRVNMSVAIVAMVAKNATSSDEHDKYHWDEPTKQAILSSFFWGYVVTQIPAGQMAQRVGPKILLLFSLGICSTLAVLTPLFASWGGSSLVMALRTVQGLSQGFIFPSTHNMLSKWAPASERGRLGTYCYAGAQFGTVIMLAISGVLASSSMGWPSIFYFSGAAGIVWSIMWFIYGGNSPDQHRSISAEEREFIESSLGRHDSKKIITPWKAIFTSAPMFALIIAHSSHNWGFWTLLTEMPTYMDKVLGLEIKANALLSSLPYLVMWILSMVFSPISDLLINRHILSRQTSRKLFNSIGLWIPMCALLGLAYVPKGNPDLAVVLLTLAVGINSATYLGFQVNHIDLAPNHAGTMMGITNCAANIMSIIAPLIVGVLLTDTTDPVQWRIVFYIAAGIYFVGNLVFVTLGKAEIQPWNEPIHNKKDDDTETAVPNNQSTTARTHHTD